MGAGGGGGDGGRGVNVCNWRNEENNFQTFIKCFFLFLDAGAVL